MLAGCFQAVKISDNMECIVIPKRDNNEELRDSRAIILSLKCKLTNTGYNPMTQHNKTVKFKDLPLDSTFTPIKMAPFFKKDPGNGQTYLKKANGVCPQVGVSKILEDGTVTNGGVFLPDDVVHPVKVPFGFIKEYVN